MCDGISADGNDRFLTDQTSRYVLQLSVRIQTHTLIYINDKKPVSSPGTIKMWQAAARPLAFAFFSRTHHAQFVGRHPSYILHIHTTRSYLYTI